MITSTLGLIDETRTDLYDKTVTTLDSKQEYTTAIEYRLLDDPVIIHRSVHVTVKKPAEFVASAIGEFC